MCLIANVYDIENSIRELALIRCYSFRHLPQLTPWFFLSVYFSWCTEPLLFKSPSMRSLRCGVNYIRHSVELKFTRFGFFFLLLFLYTISAVEQFCYFCSNGKSQNGIMPVINQPFSIRITFTFGILRLQYLFFFSH